MPDGDRCAEGCVDFLLAISRANPVYEITTTPVSKPR